MPGFRSSVAFLAMALCLVAAACSVAAAPARQSGRSASVALTAKWGNTPMLLEAAEFLVG